MAGPNPLVNLGTLNRLRGTVTFTDFPQLNITAPFLGREGIAIAFEGNAVEMLQQMVGNVQSPQVYLPTTLTVSLVKTTPLAVAFKRKWESDANLGNLTFRIDASNFDPFEMVNCALEGIDGIDASGASARMGLRIGGTYYINSNMWNL